MPEQLWAGRFAAAPDDEMMRLTRSIEVDMRLVPQDLAATKAHARALLAAGLLETENVDAIDGACDALLDDWASGRLVVHPADEDVHSVVERSLTDRLGDVGARIHAGRSRNDLVAQDLRLWCRDEAASLVLQVARLVETIAARAEEYRDAPLPGYTHLQRAQPVTVGFYLCAHGTALVRDGRRLLEARAAADVSVLGSGALAGTTLPLDATIVQAELGSPELFVNAMDAVSDRDFACDLLYAAALCGVHLSRLAEEIVIYTTAEFGFIELPDAWSTGSSMMPQKRNPDLAELVRGRAAGGVGDLTAMLTLLKGIPLAYDRDLQEDKTHVFASVDRLQGCLDGMDHLVAALKFRTDRTAAAAGEGSVWATDVAESFVLTGMPFRHAHAAAGRMVAAVEAGEPDAAATDHVSEGPEAGIARRLSHGGTAPARVDQQIAYLRESAASLIASVTLQKTQPDR